MYNIALFHVSYNNNCQTCSTGLFLDPQNGIKFGNLEKDELKLKHKHEKHKIAFSAVTMQNLLCCDLFSNSDFSPLPTVFFHNEETYECFSDFYLFFTIAFICRKMSNLTVTLMYLQLHYVHWMLKNYSLLLLFILIIYSLRQSLLIDKQR